MQRILVDMDGVLADVYSQFRKMEFEETGIYPQLDSLYGKLESTAFPFCEKHVRTKGFFRTAPLIPDSIEGLNYLNNKYEVFIVSSATEFPLSLTEKACWLENSYPFISWHQVVLCGRKDIVKGDVMIDDHPKNLDHFNGRRILFSQPHNIYISDHRYERVGSWKEIMGLL